MNTPNQDRDEYERGWQDAITHLSPPGSAERASLLSAIAGMHRTFAGVLEALVRDHERIDRALRALEAVELPDQLGEAESEATPNLDLGGSV